MKFLIIASYPSSLLNFRGPLLKALKDKGFEVHIAAPDFAKFPEDIEKLEALGFVVHNISMERTGMNPMADLRTLQSLRKLMRVLKPDYVLGYTIKPVIYGMLAARFARVPHRFALITGLGFTFTGDSDNERRHVRTLVQQLYRTALRHCQTVFFQNPDDEALFRQLNIVSTKANTCVVNGSGVDITKFNVAPLIEYDEPRFLMIARLLGDKGVREYAKAALQVKQHYPDVQFDLVGNLDSNPTSISQSELDEWTSAGTLNFLGRLNDVRPAIEACSVYVLPSYREGTPRTVLEAMAMGRAVITTDAPGCRETVIDGDNGFLIPIKNADALAQSIIKFIEQPDLIAKMGRRSRAIAEDRYDVNKVNEQMLTAMQLT